MRFHFASLCALLLALAPALLAGPNYRYESSYLSVITQEAATESTSGGAGGSFRLTIDAGPADNDIEGFIQVDEINALGGLVSLGTQVDFDENFNIESDSATRFGGRLEWGFFSLEVAMQDMKYTSDTLSGTITIFGFDIDVTQPATSVLDMPYMQFKLGFELNSAEPSEGDWFGFGLGLGIHYFDLQLDVDAREQITNTVVDESQSFPAPLPTIGLMIDIMPSNSISVEAALWALVVPDIEGVEGSIFDFNVVGKYYLLDNVAVGARFGMVVIDVEADVEDDTDRFVGDLKISSMQISAVVGFSF
ncbi:MAG: hypothetical protein KDB07_09275 [Planctomycetes bacterium]|nr:hypothetical protein [Planctomycetota bacterium]